MGKRRAVVYCASTLAARGAFSAYLCWRTHGPTASGGRRFAKAGGSLRFGAPQLLVAARLAAASAAALAACPAGAAALEPLELLGKHVFFDDNLSRPAERQACASCHDPARGWVLPNSKINRTTVVAPGARPRRLGSIKPPTNAYASFSPPFASSPAPFVAPWRGGTFWDGRAEGCGATTGPCPAAPPGGQVSETVRPADLPLAKQAAYARFLGPLADQALNPFPNDVEQNIRERRVCQEVQKASYSGLYQQAFGEAINCRNKPDAAPAYRTSFKRVAVALAAWQSSADVNSFSSKRDRALAADSDGRFPLTGLTDQENLGHDLFYGITSALNPSGRSGSCVACHNGVPPGQPADPAGEAPRQIYADSRYHNIGTPFNAEIPGVARGVKDGLRSHVPGVAPGLFKTPTVRNAAKGAGANFTKAYAHNGWFKSLESLVHFYNTRDDRVRCETLGIADATEARALANDCWPQPEFPNPAPIFGRNGLSPAEEAAIVAYVRSLTDEHTPRKP